MSTHDGDSQAIAEFKKLMDPKASLTSTQVPPVQYSHPPFFPKRKLGERADSSSTEAISVNTNNTLADAVSSSPIYTSPAEVSTGSTTSPSTKPSSLSTHSPQSPSQRPSYRGSAQRRFTASHTETKNPADGLRKMSRSQTWQEHTQQSSTTRASDGSAQLQPKSPTVEELTDLFEGLSRG
jgi:hypothetical protein